MNAAIRNLRAAINVRTAARKLAPAAPAVIATFRIASS